MQYKSRNIGIEPNEIGRDCVLVASMQYPLESIGKLA